MMKKIYFDSGNCYEFDLLEKLGAGMFGTVHKGWNAKTSAPAAIKMMDIEKILK